MTIKEWPAAERPREKLLAHGAVALSDAELLAIFLRIGMPGKSAVDLARELLSHFGSLTALFAARREEFNAIPGMGDAKYAQLQAVIEMARRALREELEQGTLLGSPRAVREYLRLSIANLPHECFMVLFVDAQNRLIAAEEMFRGTLTQTSVYAREIVKQALKHNCASVIFAHNHPSGAAEPSDADRLLTANLKQALRTVDIRVLDHLVVGGNQVLSFAERGLL